MTENYGSELLQLADQLSDDEVEDACERLARFPIDPDHQYSQREAELLTSCARTIFAYILACQKTAGLLVGTRETEYVSILTAAFKALSSWNGSHPSHCEDAYGYLEMIELMYVEDWGSDHERAPGYREFWQIAGRLRQISLRRNYGL